MRGKVGRTDPGNEGGDRRRKRAGEAAKTGKLNKQPSECKAPSEARLFPVCGLFCGQRQKPKFKLSKIVVKNKKTPAFYAKSGCFVSSDFNLDYFERGCSSLLGRLRYRNQRPRIFTGRLFRIFSLLSKEKELFTGLIEIQLFSQLNHHKSFGANPSDCILTLQYLKFLIRLELFLLHLG